MSLTAGDWALQTRTGDPKLKLVLFLLGGNADHNDVAWPDLSRLAQMCEVSPKELRVLLADLHRMGLLRIESLPHPISGGPAECYVLMVRPQPETEPLQLRLGLEVA